MVPEKPVCQVGERERLERTTRTIIIYRVGWSESAGDPVLPPTDDDLLDLQEGPSAN